MGQAKSAYNLQHALPHSVGPFSRHTTQTMPSLGIQHKLMQLAIYIYPIVYNSVFFSPLANYTDRAIAGQRS
jgi:hypothetical protein